MIIFWPQLKKKIMLWTIKFEKHKGIIGMLYLFTRHELKGVSVPFAGLNFEAVWICYHLKENDY